MDFRDNERFWTLLFSFFRCCKSSRNLLHNWHWIFLLPHFKQMYSQSFQNSNKKKVFKKFTIFSQKFHKLSLQSKLRNPFFLKIFQISLHLYTVIHKFVINFVKLSGGDFCSVTEKFLRLYALIIKDEIKNETKLSLRR